MKRRSLAFFLAVLLLCALLPATGAKAANGEKLIAFTFDDGPSQYTTQLLDGLAARGAKVTFFMQGVNASAYPSVVRRAWLEGHQICSHTYNHPNLTSLSSAGVRDQLTRTDSILDNALGFDAVYMLRPPYGSYNQSVLNIAGVPCFYWSVDTRDWESRNTEKVYQQIMRNARDGAVVLMHDIHATTIPAALRAIDSLKAQGYQFVTVSELFYRRGITLQNATMYYSAYPGSTADAVANPVIRAESGAAGNLVTITGDSRGAVYYTTNGETPTPANSTRYTGPFTLSTACTVKAVSVISWNSVRSDTVAQEIRYFPAAAPVLTLAGGQLTMTSATPNATIRYTTDESDPTAQSPVYTAPIAAVPGTTYRARAFAPGFDASVVQTLTYTANGNVMRDVTVSNWHYAAFDRAVSEGIINGVAPGIMAPDTALNRAMLVTMLYRMALPSGSAAAESFTDTDPGSYYYPALCWAVSQDIVRGYPDGSFRPDAPITREELCAMLTRYLRAGGHTLDTTGTPLAAFRDGDTVSDWAREDVAAMCALGVVRGYTDQTIRSHGGATRAEAITMLLRTEDLPAPQPAATPSAVAAEAPAADAEAEAPAADDAPIEPGEETSAEAAETEPVSPAPEA